MKAESILQASVLDIIFENRNKEYGAYELRTRYDRRLKTSMKIMISATVLICGIIYADGHFFKHRLAHKIIDPFTEVEMIKMVDEKKPQETIKPKQPTSPKKIATVNDAIPKIVRSGPTNPPRTVEEIESNQIGNKNILGEKTELIATTPVSKDSGNKTELAVEKAEPEIRETAQEMPEFPGGVEALKRFLSKNMRMPKNDLDPGTRVNVLEKFVVDENGNISGFNTLQSGGPEFDNEVIRVLKKMPKWKPGKQNGKNVSVYFKLPVIFQSQDDN
jgi:protein TonB